MASFEAYRQTNSDLTDATGCGYALFRPIAQRLDDELWRGWSPVLEIGVAVRFLPPNSVNSGEQAELAISEQYNAHTKLNHPHIAEVFDRGGTGYGSFVVFDVDEDWLTLDEHFEDNDQLPWERFALFTKILSAFEFAHHKKVYHGRLDGSQIIMSSGGPVVYGFGSLSNASARGDVLALGVLLSGLMNGHPWGWRTQRIQRVIDRATSTSPTHRYSDATALAVALDKALSAKKQWGKRFAASLGLALSLGIVGISALSAMSPPEIVLAEAVSIEPEHPLGETPFAETLVASDAGFDPTSNRLAWSCINGMVHFKSSDGKHVAISIGTAGTAVDIHPNGKSVVAVTPDGDAILARNDGSISPIMSGVTSAWYTSSGKLYAVVQSRQILHCISDKERWSIDTTGRRIIRMNGGVAIVAPDTGGSTIDLLSEGGDLLIQIKFPYSGRITALCRHGKGVLVGTEAGTIFSYEDDGWELVHKNGHNSANHLLVDGRFAYIFYPGSAFAIDLRDTERVAVLGGLDGYCHDVKLDRETGSLFATTHQGVYRWNAAHLHF
ncbi:MAG: hypothetical protein AAGC72_01170 [Planctomycetota bacterium]